MPFLQVLTILRWFNQYRMSVSGKAKEFKREINTRSRQQRILKLRWLWPSQSHKVINNPLFTGAEIRRSEQV